MKEYIDKKMVINMMISYASGIEEWMSGFMRKHWFNMVDLIKELPPEKVDSAKCDDDKAEKENAN